MLPPCGLLQSEATIAPLGKLPPRFTRDLLKYAIMQFGHETSPFMTFVCGDRRLAALGNIPTGPSPDYIPY